MARFETYTVGSQFIVLPKGLKFDLPRRARGQLHRQARRRQAQEAADRPVGHLRRRDLPPPRLARHRRPAADRRGIQPLHGLDRPRQAGQAGRRAARAQGVLRDLGQQVGRAAPGPHRPQRTSATRRCSSITTGWSRSSRRTCRWTRWSRSCSGPAAARSRTRRPTSTRSTNETLPLTENVAQVFMGMRDPVRPVPQPPVRPLDPGRLLQLRRVLLADRPQAGRGLPRDDRLQLGRRRGEPPRRRPGDAAQVPRRRGPRRRRQGPPRRAGQVARLAPEPLVRHVVRQPRLGPLHGRRASSSRSTTSASATPPRTPSCSRPWASSSPRSKYDLKSPGPRHLQLADLPAHDPAEREQRDATSGTSPTPLVRRIKAENLLDTISAVTDTKDKFQGLPLGARAVQIADGSSSTYFLTTFGRATRETVCSCEVKMEPTLSQALHLLNGDTVNAKIQQGGLIPKLLKARRRPPRSAITELYIRCLSRKPDPARSSTTLTADPRRRTRTRPRRSKTSSGRCSTAANSCSTIDPIRSQVRLPIVDDLPMRVPESRRPLRARRIAMRSKLAAAVRLGPDLRAGVGCVAAGRAADAPKAKVTYQEHVAPIFRSRCGILPQRRQAEGRPEPRQLRRGDAGRRLGQGRRAGRPRRQHARSCVVIAQGRAQDAAELARRSPTPRST